MPKRDALPSVSLLIVHDQITGLAEPFGKAALSAGREIFREALPYYSLTYWCALITGNSIPAEGPPVVRAKRTARVKNNLLRIKGASFICTCREPTFWLRGPS